MSRIHTDGNRWKLLRDGFLEKPERSSSLSQSSCLLVTALAVSISMFLKSDHLASQAEILDRVVRETDSLAEVLKASDGDMTAGAQLLSEHRGAETGENCLTLYYTANL